MAWTYSSSVRVPSPTEFAGVVGRELKHCARGPEKSDGSVLPDSPETFRRAGKPAREGGLALNAFVVVSFEDLRPVEAPPRPSNGASCGAVPIGESVVDV